MNNNEKRDFLAVITTTADLYDKQIPNERVAVYWEAVKHRSLEDIRTAINRHVQDPQRGRFFPLPADITAQLPQELSAWLTADEAWAGCPKDENDSAAMCDEVAKALNIASSLIMAGDMVAARRAFIDHYNRLVEEAKLENRKPVWWPSLGHDKDGRHKAEVEVVERNNMMLPADKKIALPQPEQEQQTTVAEIAHKAGVGEAAIAALKDQFKMRNDD